MPTFTATDYAKDIECSICLDVWNDAVECNPCKHIFCRGCIRQLDVCPECRKKIVKLDAPNRILVNMANEVKVKCDACGWVGARESSKHHRCSATPPPQQQQRTNQYSNNNGPQIRQVQYQQHHHHHQPTHGLPHHPPAPLRPIEAQGARPWETYNLTQMEYDQIFSIFLHFDADDSGELDKRELQRLARWLNFAHTDHDIDMMFRQMDTDGSGSLSMTEFCTWLKFNKPDPQSLYGMSQMDYNYVLMQFHSYDENNTGELDPRQFIQLCTANQYARNAEEAMQIFQHIDNDGNGTIDLHEFLLYRTQNQRRTTSPQQYHPNQNYPPQQQHNYNNLTPSPSTNYYQQPPPPQQSYQQYPPQQQQQQPPPNQYYQQGYQQPPPAPLGGNDRDVGNDPHHSRRDSRKEEKKKKNKDGKEDCVCM